MMRRALRSLGAIVVALGLLAPAGAAFADGSIEVNSSGDTVADDGVCTLREAIIAANTDTASGASVGWPTRAARMARVSSSTPTFLSR